MSSVFDYEDLYEEFLAFTSSSSFSVLSSSATLPVTTTAHSVEPEQENSGAPLNLESMSEESKDGDHNQFPFPYFNAGRWSYPPYWDQRTLEESAYAAAESYLYPGGIEILWREIPEECRDLLAPMDVPNSARLRGYFTVAELLGLKRLLICRFTGETPVEVTYDAANSTKVESSGLRRGLKRPLKQESEKVSVIKSTTMVGVGGVVKEAMKVLNDQANSSSATGQ